MNKINILPQDSLRILLVREQELAGFWNRHLLTGGFWRLYRHDRKGAGVFLEGKRQELVPGLFYLLPPFPELLTWRDIPVTQFYIHFELPSHFGSPEYRLNAIDPTPELEILFARARRQLQEPVNLPALALTAALAAKLPEEALTRLDHDRRIARICDYLRENPAHDPEIPELARRAGFAPNAFIRRFREVTGCSPYQYLLNLRYTLAARLLEHTDLSIEAIAAEVGVRDRFHFSRTFKRFHGTPPATYRKQRINFSLKSLISN